MPQIPSSDMSEPLLPPYSGPGVPSLILLHLPSIPQSAAAMMENKPLGLKLMLTVAFSSMQERAFMNRTVRDIMWGYDDPLVNIINKYFPGMLPIKGKFGLFSEVSVSRASAKRWGGGPRDVRSHSDGCHRRFWAWGELQARCDPGSRPSGLVPGTRSFAGVCVCVCVRVTGCSRRPTSSILPLGTGKEGWGPGREPVRFALSPALCSLC